MVKRILPGLTIGGRNARNAARPGEHRNHSEDTDFIRRNRHSLTNPKSHQTAGFACRRNLAARRVIVSENSTRLRLPAAFFVFLSAAAGTVRVSGNPIVSTLHDRGRSWRAAVDLRHTIAFGLPWRIDNVFVEHHGRFNGIFRNSARTCQLPDDLAYFRRRLDTRANVNFGQDMIADAMLTSGAYDRMIVGHGHQAQCVIDRIR